MVTNMEAAAEERTSLTKLPTKNKLKYVQICMGVIASFGSFSPGMSIGYSAIALPQLTSSDNSFQLTIAQASWFAGLGAITMPIGCLLSGPLLDRYGRKLALLLINVPCLVGWVLLATVGQSGATVVPQLYLGRLITGLATGLSSVPATIYVAEIASLNSLRSMMVTWTSVSIAAGVLVVYILGAVFQDSWRLIALICAIIPVVSFALTYLILPESPIWLVSKGRREEALKSLEVLRCQKAKQVTSAHIQTELNQIVTNYENSKRSQTAHSFLNNLAFLLRPEALKPLIIMNLYFFFQQFGGCFVVIFYSVNICKEAGVTIDEYLATVLIGLMRLIFTVVVSFISKRFGRRPLSIISGAGMTLTMGVLSLYLYLIYLEQISPELASNLSWIPVVMLLLYIATATLGFLTLPWAMIGEMFPARVRGTAGGFTTCMAYVFSFIIVKWYPQMLVVMDKHGVFFFYGAVSLVGTIFVIWFLPETKGKSLQEIEHYFKHSKNTKPHLTEYGGTENVSPLLVKNSVKTPVIKPMGSQQNLSV